MKKILILLFLFVPITLTAQTLDYQIWGAGPGVYSIATDASHIYLGGVTYYGPMTGAIAKITFDNPFPDLTFPRIDGKVTVCVPDSNGGWYVGGEFSAAGALERHNLAHIGADGSVLPWNPGTDGKITALAVSGNAVYVGGYFKTIGGVKRNYLARVNSDGQVDSLWNPNPDGFVYTIAAAPHVIFVGGDFKHIGGQYQPFAAKLYADGGVLDEGWKPLFNGMVYTIALQGDVVYFGGTFTSLWGVGPAYYAAKLSTVDGTPISPYWYPNPDLYVKKIVVAGNWVYLAGDFTQIGRIVPLERKYVACVDNQEGKPDSLWAPNPDFYVNDLFVRDSKIYLAGDFKKIGDQSIHYLARVDDFAGALDDSWRPNPSSPVYSFSASGNIILLGGNFWGLGGLNVNGLLRINKSDYSPDLGWNPPIDGTISDIVPDGPAVYVSGRFHPIGKTEQKYVARLDSASGEIDSQWNPNLSARRVVSLAVDKKAVYAAGDFVFNGPKPIADLAKIDKATGALDTSWAPNLYTDLFGGFSKIKIYGNYLYASGRFYNENRTFEVSPFRRFSLQDGQADPLWDPYPDKLVRDWDFLNQSIFVCGDFFQIGGQIRQGIAKLNWNGEADESWQADIGQGHATNIQVSRSNVYIGGNFTDVGGQNRNYLAKLSACTGEVAADWNPNPATFFTLNPDVTALKVDRDRLLVGGNFTDISGQRRINFAVFKSPQASSEGIQVVSLAEGSSSRSSFVLTADAKLYGWGYNRYGGLGIGDTLTRRFPVLVDTTTALKGQTISKVAISLETTLALSTGGRIFAWGRNKHGELGNNSTKNSCLPVAVDTSGVLANQRVVDIAVGEHHFAAAVTAAGEVVTWGRNNWGQLGVQAVEERHVPGYVYSEGELKGKKIISVSAGGNYLLVLSADGHIYGWGHNTFGQLGCGTTSDSVFLPVAVDTSGGLRGKKVVQISAGVSFSLALTADGKVYAWGDNYYGQLGNGTNTRSSIPVEVGASSRMANKKIVAIAAGGFHSLALASDGSLFAWGDNEYGQLGANSSAFSVNSPVLVDQSGVLKGKRIVAISAGDLHSLALSCDGSVFAWGLNEDGQLADGSNSDSFVPVAVQWTTIPNRVWRNPSRSVRFALSQNYPNPFNPTTLIHYTLPRSVAGKVITLKIYDALGREVATLIQKKQNPGNHIVKFKAANIASGVYFYTLRAGNFSMTKKMLLMR